MTTHSIGISRRGWRAVWVLTVSLVATSLSPVSARADSTLDPAVEAQQLVYEVNLARWNPPAFATLAGEVTFPEGWLARPPQAINPNLTASGMFKANELADHDYWAHQSAVTGKWPNELAREYGYALPSWWIDDANYIESLHAGSGNPVDVVASFARSPGHRAHVFGEGGWGAYNEIGVGRSTREEFWSIHTAYREPTRVFVTGVVFDDGDGDGRMDMGEGRGGVTVKVGATSTTTNPGGGYSVQVSAGTYAVSATNAGSGTVTVGSHNVGVDFVAGTATPTVRAYQLCNGLAPTMLGTSGDDVLYATSGRDVIHGLEGTDIVIGAAADDILCSAQADTGGATERLAGADRFATAAAISQSTHPGGAEVVYVAVGTNYPDAIAAGSAAAAQGAPILLVGSTSLPEVTRAELKRLDPSRIVILGGTTAVARAVEDALARVVPGASILRHSGKTRYETAAQVSASAFTATGGVVYITTGEDFATAIAVAPAAVATGSPMLLVRRDSIPPAVATELRRLAPREIIVVGGRLDVSDGVVGSLASYAPTVRRISSSNGYEAAVAVSSRTFAPGLDTVYIAVGDRFPDALAGGPATKRSPGPMLLVTSNDVPPAVLRELDRLQPGRIIILGGTAAVSSSVEFLLAGYATGS